MNNSSLFYYFQNFLKISIRQLRKELLILEKKHIVMKKGNINKITEVIKTKNRKQFLFPLQLKLRLSLNKEMKLVNNIG